MAEEKKEETIDAGNPNLGALSGLGMDTSTLKERINEVTGAKTEETKEAKAEETKKEEETTKAKAEEKDEVKVGDEVLINKEVVKDGDYKLEDGTKVAVKDSKIETIYKKEEKEEEKFKEDIDNPFVTKEKEEKKSEEKVELEDFEKAAEFLSQKTGIEVKKLNDINKVVSGFSEIKEQLKEVSSEKSDLLVYKDVFEKMPDDLYSITQAWLNNEDYHILLNKLAGESLDFTKSFEEHSLEKLIENYSNEKFSEEDYQAISDKEDERHKQMQGVVNLTRKAYNKDKDAFRTARKEYEDGIGEHRKTLKNSINGAIDHLTKNVPELKEEHKTEIVKVLEAGHNGIYNMFFNEKNDTFRSEAGEFIALALYGKAAIEYQSKIAAKKAAIKAESKANEEIVTRSADKTKPTKGEAPKFEEKVLETFKEHVLPKSTMENPFLKSM